MSRGNKATSDEIPTRIARALCRGFKSRQKPLLHFRHTLLTFRPQNAENDLSVTIKHHQQKDERKPVRNLTHNNFLISEVFISDIILPYVLIYCFFFARRQDYYDGRFERKTRNNSISLSFVSCFTCAHAYKIIHSYSTSFKKLSSFLFFNV